MCSRGRVFICKRCGVQVTLCARCDHGHEYCSKSCSREGRRARRRVANRRNANTETGRKLNRERQKRFRMRQAEKERQRRMGPVKADVTTVPDRTSKNSVTDHGSPPRNRRLSGRNRHGGMIRHPGVHDADGHARACCPQTHGHGPQDGERSDSSWQSINGPIAKSWMTTRNTITPTRS